MTYPFSKTRSRTHADFERGYTDIYQLLSSCVPQNHPSIRAYPRHATPSNRRKCTHPDFSPTTIVVPSGAIAQHCIARHNRRVGEQQRLSLS